MLNPLNPLFTICYVSKHSTELTVRMSHLVDCEPIGEATVDQYNNCLTVIKIVIVRIT